MTLNETLSCIQPAVRSLSAYHLDAPPPSMIKLNQNECPWDWPAEIKEQAARLCRERPWNRYPDFIPHTLKEALGGYVGAGADNIIVGNGSNEMLLVSLLSCMDRTRPVVCIEPTFTVYRLLVEGMGGTRLVVPLGDDCSYDVEGICRALTDHPGAPCILCSPNNPTGGALGESEIRAVLAASSGICLLDQAYVEFGGCDATALREEHPNLIITRTLSKAFGGASMRIGYMIGHADVISRINRIKLPYNVNFFTAAAAQVCIENRSVMQAQVSRIVAQRDSLYDFLRGCPFDAVYPSLANFVCVRLSRKRAFIDFLRENGILVRDVSAYPKLEGCVRITVGTPEENQALRRAIATFFFQKGR